MLSIDEAIALVKIERECVIRADVCDRKCEKCDLLQDSTELTDMYEQLVEWLEELKMLRELKAEHRKIGNIEGFNEGYNKAIDDVLKTMRKDIQELLQSPWANKNYMSNHNFEVREAFTIIDDLILKKDIEQLKAGGD